MLNLTTIYTSINLSGVVLYTWKAIDASLNSTETDYVRMPIARASSVLWESVPILNARYAIVTEVRRLFERVSFEKLRYI